MATLEDVRRIATALPGVEEVDGRKWCLRTGMVVWERPLRKADLAHLGPSAPTGLVVGVRTGDLEAKEEALAELPDVVFTTPHFDGYPAVLVRLDAIDLEALEVLITDAWVARAPKRVVAAWRADT